MVFKGTATRSALDINREFDEIGAQYNAFTSEEQTVFYGCVLPEFEGRLMVLLADLMQPFLDPDEFETERKVILEEIALYEDRPGFQVSDKLRQKFFGDHPLGHLVLGSNESISAMTVDQMRGYHDRRYRTGGITLALSGCFDWERVLDQASQLTADWSSGQPGRDLEIPAVSLGTWEERHPRFQHIYGGWMSPGFSPRDSRHVAAGLAAMVLGGGRGSRLYWDTIRPGLALSCHCYHAEEDGCGFFAGSYQCAPERVSEVRECIARNWECMLQDGVQAEELERMKRKAVSALCLQGETPLDRLTQLAGGWVYRGILQRLEEAVAEISRVTPEQVNASLAGMNPENRAELVLIPDGSDITAVSGSVHG
jgi:predicted Zn-dependent peptidase